MSSKGSNITLALKSFYQRLFLRSSEGEVLVATTSFTFTTPGTDVLPADNYLLKTRRMPDTSFLPSTTTLLY